MSTRTLAVVTLSTLVAVMLGRPLAMDAGERVVIVGEDGRVLILPEDRSLEDSMVDTSELHGAGVEDAVTVIEDHALFVMTYDLKLYRLDLLNPASGYDRILTDEGDLSTSPMAWLDSSSGQPAWLERGDGERPSSVWSWGLDRRARPSRPGDIEFRDGFVFGLHIDGWKTSEELAGLSPDLSGLTRDYTNDEWILLGRSARIAAYGRKLVGHVEVGERFRATLLLQDRSRNRWLVHSLDEHCNVSVYGDMAVIREMHDVRDDRHPETGNFIQSRPTGKWHFYDPETHGVVQRQLDPSVEIHFASSGEAFLVDDGRLLTLSLDGDPTEPRVLMELPVGFEVAVIRRY